MTNQQQPPVQNTINLTSSVDTNLLTGSSWKTISGKHDKRKRKPAEKPVLAKQIPGHQGEQELDWLVNFIESGNSKSTNTSNNSSKNNGKGKTNGKSDTNNISRHTSRTSAAHLVQTNNNTNAKKTETNTINKENNRPAPTSQPKTIRANVGRSKATSINSNTNNNATGGNQKKQLTQSQTKRSALNDHCKTNFEGTITKRIEPRSTKQAIDQTLLRKISNELSSSEQSLDENQIEEQDDSDESAAHLEESHKQESNPLNTKNQKDISQPDQRQTDHEVCSELELQHKPLTGADAAVTFAQHLQVEQSSGAQQYSFGFFDEEQAPNKVSGHKIANKLEISVNPNDKLNQYQERREQDKQQPSCPRFGNVKPPKYPKASHNSESRSYTFNDNIDTSSFNYDQILEYISKAWESKKKPHRAHNGVGRDMIYVGSRARTLS